MSLHFQVFGSGPPLVLMHGLFGSGDNLRILARNLEQRFRVFLPDLPNHGGSPHLGSSTHEAMAESAEEFLSEHNIDAPLIGGHSIGGKIAMLMALRDPDRYRGLISIDMAPRRYEASHLQIIAAMRRLHLDSVSSRRDADEALKVEIPEASVRAFLLKNLSRDENGYSWQLNLDAIEQDYNRMLGWEPPDAQFAGPAAFIGGGKSRYLQEDRDRDLIRSWFPEAEISMIPEAGHWLHADKPEQLLETINSFLDGVTAG